MLTIEVLGLNHVVELGHELIDSLEICLLLHQWRPLRFFLEHVARRVSRASVYDLAAEVNKAYCICLLSVRAFLCRDLPKAFLLTRKVLKTLLNLFIRKLNLHPLEDFEVRFGHLRVVMNQNWHAVLVKQLSASTGESQGFLRRQQLGRLFDDLRNDFIPVLVLPWNSTPIPKLRVRVLFYLVKQRLIRRQFVLRTVPKPMT